LPYPVLFSLTIKKQKLTELLLSLQQVPRYGHLDTQFGKIVPVGNLLFFGLDSRCFGPSLFQFHFSSSLLNFSTEMMNLKKLEKLTG
jgi:hypothetical protein